jgi:hypothetical protein
MCIVYVMFHSIALAHSELLFLLKNLFLRAFCSLLLPLLALLLSSNFSILIHWILRLFYLYKGHSLVFYFFTIRRTHTQSKHNKDDKWKWTKSFTAEL